MTDVGRLSVGELAGKVLADEHTDVLRPAVVWLAQKLMEAKVAERAGAGYGERPPDRVARRNGYRERAWDTQVGSIELAIPKLLRLVLPELPRAAAALGASPGRRRPGGLRQRGVDPQDGPAGGGPGAGRSVQEPGVAALPRTGRAGHGLPRAAPGGRLTVLVAGCQGPEGPRAGGRVEHRALVVAYGVDASGQREVIGLDVGAAETEAFWREFLRSLVRRAFGVCSWSSPTPMRVSRPRSLRC
jgi:putative transposase